MRTETSASCSIRRTLLRQSDHDQGSGHRLAFANNIIPAGQLSEGLALLRAFPTPTAGFQRGQRELDRRQPETRETRARHAAVDYVMGAANQLSIRASHFAWKSVDAFRGSSPLARTDWSRPNTTAAFSWTGTIKKTSQMNSLRLFARRWCSSTSSPRRLVQTQTGRHQLSVHFAPNRNLRQDPTISIAAASTMWTAARIRRRSRGHSTPGRQR